MRFASFSLVVIVAVSSAKPPALPSRPMIVCFTASCTRGGAVAAKRPMMSDGARLATIL